MYRRENTEIKLGKKVNNKRNLTNMRLDLLIYMTCTYITHSWLLKPGQQIASVFDPSHAE